MTIREMLKFLYKPQPPTITRAHAIRVARDACSYLLYGQPPLESFDPGELELVIDKLAPKRKK